MTSPHWRRRLRRRRLAVELAARAHASEAPEHLGESDSVELAGVLPFHLVAEESPEVGAAVVPGPTVPSEPATSATDAEPAAPRTPTGAEQDLLCRAAAEAIERGEWRRGAAICREVLDANPGHSEARRYLAWAFEGAGDSERALVELNRALTCDAGDTRARIDRAALLGRRGHYAEAEQDLRVVLERNPANAEACHQLGIVISRKARWRDAVPHLRRAVELDAGRAEAYLSLAEALNHVDDLSGALQAYQRAVELRPNSARALYGLGIVLDRLNRPADAALMYRRSREIGTA
ncbi:MAG: tetratricopeptide repeat protein [Gemmatimonadetes bacterium]|nr:tetratricopeptide repeat protein [Gemmatimonadota bacterium]